MSDNFEWCSSCGWVLPGHGHFAETQTAKNAMNEITRYVDIVFDGPPSHESGRFVEAESPEHVGTNIGEWIDRGDGYWALRIPLGDADHERVVRERDARIAETLKALSFALSIARSGEQLSVEDEAYFKNVFVGGER